MHDADKKIPPITEEYYKMHYPDGHPFTFGVGVPHDQSRPWRALLAGAIIGLIGVLLFVVMSACVPLRRDDGAGQLYKILRYMEQRR